MLSKKKIGGVIIGLIAIVCIENTFAQDSINNPKVDTVLSEVNKVETNKNFIENFSPDNNVSLPFGIIKQVGSVRYVIAIDSCKFKPAGAYFNAYAAIEFPGTTKKLAFEGMNIKFNPQGVIGGNQARLMLVSEHTIKINNTVSLQLKNDGSNWVEWDCGGFKAINLKGYFIFNKGKLYPDKTQTKDTVVTASFQIYTTDIHNFITQVSITPFMIEGLKDWAFSVTNATVDMSELDNPKGMIFPVGYTNPNMITPPMWTGFYLQSVKVKIPSEISKTGKRTELTANDLLIDHMGLTGLFQINNVIRLDEGSMSGWDFSVDELGIGFVCNQLNSGHLKGRVTIPATDTSQSLTYAANVCYNPTNKETDYNFMITPTGVVKFNVFAAEITLNNTSKIIIVKSNGLFQPKAILNGYMSFKNAKFDSNGGQLEFQDLTFITQSPYISNGIFTLHTIGAQTKAANYPISIDKIFLGISAGSPLIGFDIRLNILDKANASFSIGTTVKVKGKIIAQQISYTGEVPVSYTKTKWKFDRVTISGFNIDLQTSPFTLKGFVDFRDNDPIYGDGFFGKITFSIVNVLPNPASITACFGSVNSYRYFYVDAVIPVSIPLGSLPITLTSLMGGIYYHMKPLNADQAQMIALSQNQSPTATNALSYVPDQSTNLGFKSGVGFIYSPSSKTANGDVMFEVTFTSSGGLGLVKLAGDVYIMAEPKDRPKAPIVGTITIQYDVPNKTFDSNADIKINAYNAVIGVGSSKIHIEPALWYASVGTPLTPNEINIINLVHAKSYFMVGSSIEPALAPPPQVAAILKDPSWLSSKRDEGSLKNGAGFCTGASIAATINTPSGFDFFSIYSNFNFGMGFDLMMMNYGPNGHCQGSTNKIGMNSWLANGDMYLYMNGAVGIKGSAHFPSGCNCDEWWECLCEDFDFKVFSGGFAGIAEGKLPNPTFFRGQFACHYEMLGGLVKGNFDYKYKYGTDCIPAY